MGNQQTGSISSTVKLVLLFLALWLLSFLSNMYVDWLWFTSVDFKEVFITFLFNKVGLYCLVFLLVFVIFAVNLLIARRNLADQEDNPYQHDPEQDVIYLNRNQNAWKEFLQSKSATWLFIGVSLLGAFLVSSVAADNWIVVQQYFNRVAVGTTDPIFNKDLSFYFFNLNFYQFVYSILMSSLVLLFVTLIVVYILNASSAALLGNWREFTFAKGHLAVILALIFALKSWGYKLNTYELLFSQNDLIFGATYTDVHARLLALKVLIIVSIIVALIILANIFVRKLNWILIGVGAWLGIAIIMGSIYPALMQSLIVQPNEFNKEKPYLENSIAFTRQAYALDRAENREFKVDYDLNINDPEHESTINNIRLWDWLPLKTTYQNLQQLRPYYVFDDVDIDRYTIDGRYRQVMLSAREIDQSELTAEAQTWINQRLMYTHGYGVVVSPVTEVEEEGFPQFIIKDIPPQFSTDLKVTRPEIYFGERTNSYVIVNTHQKEFDYPMGDENVFSTYEGQSGIKVGSIGKRLILAWVLKDYKIILSNDIHSESQVLMNRNIMQRVQKIAPYLRYDQDPYIVINDEGHLYWMLDAYTCTDKYPYSEPFDSRGNNYIRNSVKITMNAYNGDMKFYVAYENDPIIKTYEKIFPNMYLPLDSMPDSLKAHIRYPVDMFQVQANMYRTFHMTDTNVFYNKEDLWIIPNEIIGEEPQQMEPYYLILQLPGETEAEYVLMLPYAPKSRPNMIAWMAARMDRDHYGNMIVYNFPKQETVYGPEQIEARINQNTEIAQQLTLWSQRGSRIHRGNLLVIPMANSTLYVEPLYLQAENGRIPELKRVIAAFGNKIVMEPSLDQALLKLFGEQPTTDAPDTGQPPVDEPSTSSSISDLVGLARDYYDRAEERLREGDWAGYGANIDKLEEIINQLEEAALD
ncbi:MAG: UPF0182 family protein [Bacillota bacterium]|nr:UPF0182 family protein [Bacillota bacterium]